jgi:hypothetical protein
MFAVCVEDVYYDAFWSVLLLLSHLSTSMYIIATVFAVAL